MRPRTSGYHLLSYYSSAALWNLCMGMVQVLLPLYANALGFSILKISSLIALPALAEIGVRFLGSAYSDRFGERRVLQACFWLMFVSGVVLVAAESYSLLFVAQTLANFSRSNFWIAIQSLGSQLPGANVGKRLGRLSACNYGGNLIGLSLGGVLAALVGYPKAFLLLSAAAFVCILLGLALPDVASKPGGRTVWAITRGIGQFLSYRPIWLIISVSYAAALPSSLTQSIYPVYFAQMQYGEQWIGAAISVRSLAPILMGLALGSMIAIKRQREIYAVGMAGLGISLICSGLAESLSLGALLIALLGASGAVMDLLYQVQASEWSQPRDRSVAMATAGLGWVVCPFSAPLIVGWLAEAHGFGIAFMASGVFFLLASLGTRLWHRLLAPAEELKA
ncbi:MAG: MFS transporter [Deltaproteobacteria bacterium]|nr:MFS transporter [Deltaproteobacteria bacterium]